MSKIYPEMGSKPFMYLAAPLFSAAERAFNRELSAMLGQSFTVYLPQRDGGLFVDLIGRGVPKEEAARQIFLMDTKAIEKSDFVLAVLDGRSIDEGVALELGYAFGLGKVCIGLQTDPRRLLPEGNNPMITGVLHRVVTGIDELKTVCADLVTQFSDLVQGHESDQ